MKCKDCAVSKVVICPECSKKVILCMEAEDLVQYEFWDSEHGIGCDGIIED